MDIFKILALALCAVFFALIVKGQRPDIALLLSLCAGVLILLAVLEKLTGIIGYIQSLGTTYGFNNEYISIAVKITGIAFLCDFAVNLCKDADQNAIAAKLEMAGKITLIVMVLPIIGELLGMIGKLLAL